MIEMGRQDDPLVARAWDRSRGASRRRCGRSSVPGSLPGIGLGEFAVEERLELERAEPIDQVGRRLLAPCSAPAAELRRGQRRHDLRAAGLPPAAAGRRPGRRPASAIRGRPRPRSPAMARDYPRGQGRRSTRPAPAGRFAYPSEPSRPVMTRPPGRAEIGKSAARPPTRVAY